MRHFQLIICISFCMTSILYAENHLKPVEPLNDNYSQAVFKALIPESKTRFWMIVQPSFEPEYSVVLKEHYEWDKSSPDEALWDVTNTTYSVAKVIVKDKIWKWKELDDRSLVLDISPTNSVIQHETDVSEEFTKHIQNAWEGVLKQTRYPEEENCGLDGVTYYFYSWYDYFGKTWSPEKGLPYELVQLGNKLGELASSKEKNEACIKEECRSLATNIINETKDSNQQVEPIVTTPVDKVEAQSTQAHP